MQLPADAGSHPCELLCTALRSTAIVAPVQVVALEHVPWPHRASRCEARGTEAHPACRASPKSPPASVLAETTVAKAHLNFLAAYPPLALPIPGGRSRHQTGGQRPAAAQHVQPRDAGPQPVGRSRHIRDAVRDLRRAGQLGVAGCGACWLATESGKWDFALLGRSRPARSFPCRCARPVNLRR